ncbi:MAG TPA: DASS family sodium-coupled anion symporter [Candidatus Bipolaricaulota bacterium]
MHFLRTLLAWRWLILGLLLGVTLLLLPTPQGLTSAGQRALAIAAVAALFFITEPFPLPAVALLIAAFQVLLGLGSGNEVARSFMGDSVFFIMGSLMISVALVKQRLDRRIAYAILRMTGPHLLRILFGFTATSALLASLIGEHTVAAMMLPVALAILHQARKDEPHLPNLTALLLFSVAYGAMIAGIGTPSGGARNAIMVDYWQKQAGVQVSYLDWIAHAYPLVLLQIPVLIAVLWWTFPPELKDLRRALVRLRQEVHGGGRLTGTDLQVIGVFLLTMLGWIALSGQWGLGTIAIMGAALYLALGLVRWEDLNNGMNWGVVLLYASAISLGVQMKQSGAADWLAQNFLSALSVLHLDQGIALWIAWSLLTVVVAHTMSAGASVAMLGPIALHVADLSGTSVVTIGFITAIGSAFSYMMTVVAPSASIVYSSGLLAARDFWKAGSRMVVASLLILWLVASLYWPLLGG